MKKKILTVILTLIVMISTLTNTYAADNFFNLGVFQTAYKLSNEADIDLPFINVFSKAATYDEDVKHSGISIGESIIDIDEKLEGVHLIMASDMITIKGEVEHGIIYGTNIVVEGKISGDTILIANSVKILEGAVIEKDVVIVADNMEMAGTIKGNLIGAASTVSITGTIENDLRVDISNIAINEATINGDIYINVPAGTADSLVGITEKYPNAVINEKVENVNSEIKGEEIAKIVFNGVKVVLIYTIIGLLITKKENNIVSKATARFTENSSFGILTGTAMFMLSIVGTILLILLATIGLGVIAWPILVIYLGLILLCVSISSFVVGMTLYQVVKNKVGKYKIPVLVGIFAVIYVLSQISAISFYVFAAINLVSMAVIMSYIFKREEYVNETVVEAKVIDDNKDK